MLTNIDKWFLTAAALGGQVAGLAAQAPTPQFGPAQEYPVPGARANGYVLFADVNGDGLQDAVLSDLVVTAIKVMLQQASGTFSAGVDTAFSAPFLNYDPAYALADLNEDGLADIVAGTRTSNLPSPGSPNLAVRFGDSSGQFINQLNLNNQPGAPFPSSAGDRGIAFGDVNQDGHIDIISKTSGTAASNYVQGISVMLGDGNGGFGTSIESGQGAYQFVLIGDVDGDGNVDVVSVNDIGSDSHAMSQAKINLGDGSGSFTFTGLQTFDCRLSTGSGNPRMFLEDVDNDGSDDLIMFGNPGSQTGAGGLYIRKSIGGGAFVETFRLISSTLSTVLLADLNGDSCPEIIRFAKSFQGVNQVLINDGAGAFPTTAPFPVLSSGFEPRDATAASIQGNMLLDVAVMGVHDGLAELRLYVFENTSVVGPTSYCTAGTTTNGCVPAISATGTASASSSSGFTISVVNIEGQRTGLLFYGTNGAQSAPWGAGSSLLCVKPPTQRMSTLASGGTFGTCNGVIAEDWNTYIATHPTALGHVFAGGESIWAQAWFRDPPAPKTTNLSDGLVFLVAP